MTLKSVAVPVGLLGLRVDGDVWPLATDRLGDKLVGEREVVRARDRHPGRADTSREQRIHGVARREAEHASSWAAEACSNCCMISFEPLAAHI